MFWIKRLAWLLLWLGIAVGVVVDTHVLRISRRLGFAVKAHRLQITATCEEFKKLGACSKKSA